MSSSYVDAILDNPFSSHAAKNVGIFVGEFSIYIVTVILMIILLYSFLYYTSLENVPMATSITMYTSAYLLTSLFLSLYDKSRGVVFLAPV